jgi:perosamine synthetase
MDESRRLASHSVGLAPLRGQAVLIDGVLTPVEPVWARTNWQRYCVESPGSCDQQSVMQRLLDGGVSTRRGVMNAHLERPNRSSSGRTDRCRSERAQQRGLILPLAPGMTPSQVQIVCAALAGAIEAAPPVSHASQHV